MSIKLNYHSLWKWRTSPRKLFNAIMCRLVGHRLNNEPRHSWCGRCGLAYEEVYHIPWTTQAEQPKNYHMIMREEYGPDKKKPAAQAVQKPKKVSQHQLFVTAEQAYEKCLEYNVGKKPYPYTGKFGGMSEFLDPAILLVLKKPTGPTLFVAIEATDSEFKMIDHVDAEVLQLAIPRPKDWVILSSSRLDPMFIPSVQEVLNECAHFGLPVAYLELRDEEKAEFEAKP